jgi:hypothetical protein
MRNPTLKTKVGCLLCTSRVKLAYTWHRLKTPTELEKGNSLANEQEYYNDIKFEI